MSSILTNTSAMVALQTLKGINSSLEMAQSMISTGKSVASAKDNAAVWAISKVMESDVAGFKAISDSLSLGESTVAVARNASETVTDLLKDIKTKIVAAQEDNVDRSKIQTDIGELTNQIASVVGAAQFNGLNLINGASTEDVSVLASLDRDSSGSVTASNITVARQDLSFSNTSTPATFGGAAVTDTSIASNLSGGNAGTPVNLADGISDDVTIVSVADGNSYRITLDDTAADNSLGSRTFEYVANADDSLSSVAANLQNQISAFFSATGETGYTVSRTDNVISLENVTGGGGGAIAVNVETATGGTAGTTTGGLGALASIDVTTEAGATFALGAVETLIQTSIDAAAAFGSVESRIEIQANFVSKLTDSLQSGIGAMVDADMEEASARLQALQVQQQLGIQSLSIANQQPNSILSLFR
ncbi:MAG: flagellin [Mangrovicoccus sp.]|nr:flagellin [Mangrovicoccus sp.]